MKRFATLGFVIIAIVAILVITTKPAKATEGCVINVVGIKVCGQLVGQPLPEVVEVTVTPPPVTIPGPTSTVTILGPTKTATVHAPGETKTVYRREVVRVPGPERTVAGPVATKTVGPVTQTETVTPSPRTVVKTVTRQPTPNRAMLGPNDEEKYLFDLPPVTTPGAVGIGLGTIIFIVAGILLSMMGGYYMGYKDSDRENANFINALRDKVIYRGKHS